jgi:hypothetical protein
MTRLGQAKRGEMIVKLEMHVDSIDKSKFDAEESKLYESDRFFRANKPRTLTTSMLNVYVFGETLRIRGDGHRSDNGTEYCVLGWIELDREALQKILDQAIKDKLVRLPDISGEEIKAKLLKLPGIEKVAQAKLDLEQAMKKLDQALKELDLPDDAR